MTKKELADWLGQRDNFPPSKTDSVQGILHGIRQAQRGETSMETQFGIMMRSLWNELSEWSQKTFGDDLSRGPEGALEHLKMEADEALETPCKLEEYADCLILILDAARRAGFSMDQLGQAAVEKLETNKTRTYPKTPPGVPSQHVKDDPGHAYVDRDPAAKKTWW